MTPLVSTRHFKHHSAIEQMVLTHKPLSHMVIYKKSNGLCIAFRIRNAERKLADLAKQGK
jgi:hypothetical protein